MKMETKHQAMTKMMMKKRIMAAKVTLAVGIMATAIISSEDEIRAFQQKI
jgi:hypothetical protein